MRASNVPTARVLVNEMKLFQRETYGNMHFVFLKRQPTLLVYNVYEQQLRRVHLSAFDEFKDFIGMPEQNTLTETKIDMLLKIFTQFLRLNLGKDEELIGNFLRALSVFVNGNTVYDDSIIYLSNKFDVKKRLRVGLYDVNQREIINRIRVEFSQNLESVVFDILFGNFFIFGVTAAPNEETGMKSMIFTRNSADSEALKEEIVPLEEDFTILSCLQVWNQQMMLLGQLKEGAPGLLQFVVILFDTESKTIVKKI